MTNKKSDPSPVKGEDSEIPHTRRIRGILVPTPTTKMVGKIRDARQDPTDSVIGKSRY
jgi:hypothetical protein